MKLLMLLAGVMAVPTFAASGEISTLMITLEFLSG